MKLKANKMGSMKALKESLKKGGGGSQTYIKNVPADGITVRFLTEPEEWFGFMEYWDGDAKSFVPMVEGEILPDGAKSSFRYLANAVDMDSDRVIPLKLSKTCANSLILKYDKYDTITDRAYELQKHGEGLDTTYDVTPDAPSKMNLAKYDLLDLEQILVDARLQATGETATASAGSSPTATATKSAKSSKPVVVEDDDDDEDFGEDHDYGEFNFDELFPNGNIRVDYSMDELICMSADDHQNVCDLWEIDINDSEWMVMVMDAQEANALLDDEDDDDSDTEDDEDDSDDDTEEYDLDDLEGMGLPELRAIAKSLDIATAGLNKNALIQAIVESAED